MLKLTRLQIAIICHELNRAYCHTLGDYSQKPWEEAAQWQRESIIAGVHAIADGLVTNPMASHESWMAKKLAEGWTVGPKKNARKKEHPCLVPFGDMPLEQQAKDLLFFNTASTLLRLIDDLKPTAPVAQLLQPAAEGGSASAAVAATAEPAAIAETEASGPRNEPSEAPHMGIRAGDGGRGPER